jgi:hypothetical protein
MVFENQNFQAMDLEVKKGECKSDTEFIEVKNCSMEAFTKHLTIVHIQVVFVKVVKDLTVIRDSFFKLLRSSVKYKIFNG